MLIAVNQNKRIEDAVCGDSISLHVSLPWFMTKRHFSRFQWISLFVHYYCSSRSFHSWNAWNGGSLAHFEFFSFIITSCIIITYYYSFDLSSSAYYFLSLSCIILSFWKQICVELKTPLLLFKVQSSKLPARSSSQHPQPLTSATASKPYARLACSFKSSV